MLRKLAPGESTVGFDLCSKKCAWWNSNFCAKGIQRYKNSTMLHRSWVCPFPGAQAWRLHSCSFWPSSQIAKRNKRTCFETSLCRCNGTGSSSCVRGLTVERGRKSSKGHLPYLLCDSSQLVIWGLSWEAWSWMVYRPLVLSEARWESVWKCGSAAQLCLCLDMVLTFMFTGRSSSALQANPSARFRTRIQRMSDPNSGWRSRQG